MDEIKGRKVARIHVQSFFTRVFTPNGWRMNKIGLNSFVIEYEDGYIDVFMEIRKTTKVPYDFVYANGPDPDYVLFDAPVFDLIRRFIKDGGYAGLSLSEYLESFY